MIVIGLTGRAGAGKGVVADHLVAEHGFTKVSFAGPLKQMLRTLDPIVGTYQGAIVRLSNLYARYGDDAGIKASPYGPEVRRLWQVLGTDCIRAVDEGFWVRAALAQLTDRDGRYVFDDVRFPNEARAVGFNPAWCDLPNSTHLWRVIRPGHDGGAGNHVSEQHADTMPVDLEIWNTDSLAILRQHVNLSVDEILRA